MVLVPDDTGLYGIFKDFAPAEAQKRTYEPGAGPRNRNCRDRLHPCQAFDACAPKQIQEKGLDIVIGIVGDRHERISPRPAEFVKPFVAKGSRRHLKADPMLGGIFTGREVLFQERHSRTAAPVPDKGFVTVACLPSQVEVAVGDLKRNM